MLHYLLYLKLKQENETFKFLLCWLQIRLSCLRILALYFQLLYSFSVVCKYTVQKYQTFPDCCRQFYASQPIYSRLGTSQCMYMTPHPFWAMSKLNCILSMMASLTMYHCHTLDNGRVTAQLTVEVATKTMAAPVSLFEICWKEQKEKKGTLLENVMKHLTESSSHTSIYSNSKGIRYQA